MGGRAALGLVEGLADVFEGIGWEADLFWDILKACPRASRYIRMGELLWDL